MPFGIIPDLVFGFAGILICSEEANMGGRWWPGRPPKEASSRVTNPERFAALHRVALELTDELEREFEIERREAYGLDPELEGSVKAARPPIALLPQDLAAAPIVFAFSTFPGLWIRAGRWHVEAFPRCGCDACDETAEDETERLNDLVRSVIAGRYKEALRIREDGQIRQVHEAELTSGPGVLNPVRSQEFTALSEDLVREWGPWPRRGPNH